MRYQFACDARVSLDIEAETLQEARDRWDQFCYDMECDNVLSHQGHTPYVALQDGEPDILDENGEPSQDAA